MITYIVLAIIGLFVVLLAIHFWIEVVSNKDEQLPSIPKELCPGSVWVDKAFGDTYLQVTRLSLDRKNIRYRFLVIEGITITKPQESIATVRALTTLYNPKKEEA